MCGVGVLYKYKELKHDIRIIVNMSVSKQLKVLASKSSAENSTEEYNILTLSILH